MLLVDVTYILNLGKVKVRVINIQALPIQCVLTLWIQIVVMDMFTASVAICIQQTVTLHFWYFNALFYSHLP